MADRTAAERAAATKALLAAKYAERKKAASARHERREALQAVLARGDLTDEDKARAQAAFDAAERELLREARKRYSAADFEELVVIGRGAFGEVSLVRGKEDGRVYAMKRMSKESMILKNQTAHVRAERDAMAAADNPWVVKLHYSFQDEDSLFLVLDFCAGGDLMSLLIAKDVLPEAWVRQYAAEAIEAIGSIHRLGFIHRDLKPDNILFDEAGHLKLTDLGLCKRLDDPLPAALDELHQAAGQAAMAAEDDTSPLVAGGAARNHHQHDRPVDATAAARAAAAAAGGAGQPSTEAGATSSSSSPPPHPAPAYIRERRLAFSTVGTPDYISPQVLQKRGYSYETDWWSIGVILYECLLGFPPFYGSDPVSTCRKILHWKTTLKWPADRTAHLSPACLDFLRSLLTDPERRLGTHGGAAELRAHPWFAGLDWARLRETPAPWVPPNGPAVPGLLARLATLPRTSPDFPAVIKGLTSCFDDFDALPADDPRNAFAGGGGGGGGGGGAGGGADGEDAGEGEGAGGSASAASSSGHRSSGVPGRRLKNRLVGYTFKRPASTAAVGGAAGLAALLGAAYGSPPVGSSGQTPGSATTASSTTPETLPQQATGSDSARSLEGRLAEGEGGGGASSVGSAFPLGGGSGAAAGSPSTVSGASVMRVRAVAASPPAAQQPGSPAPSSY